MVMITVGNERPYRLRVSSSSFFESLEDCNKLKDNDTINGTISDLESEILDILRKDGKTTVPEMVEICNKSSRTITRAISSLKAKN
ncbi:hypothetical protein P261_02691 [Lachnospiraceae bacterium TWA4]|nr:hypothetical protein P261_02691 [Lachnospiraceae bacterium TWA4]